MQDLLNATDVRRHWSQFNDDVVREGPKFVRRNRDKWGAFSSTHLKAAFEQFTFEVEFLHEEDNTVTAVLKGFDIIENGDNEDEALDLVIDELVEYAHEYQENFNMYYQSPNRRKHLPYIINVLAQEDDEGVKALIKCPAGER